MNSLILRTSREARVLAVLLQAAGLASLAGACGKDKSEGGSSTDSVTSASTDEFECQIEYFETVECFAPSEGLTTGDATTGGVTTGDATTGGPTTGGVTTGEATTGEATTGGPTTGEVTTGDMTTGSSSSTGTTGDATTGDATTGDATTGTTAMGTTGGGLCEGFKPKFPIDCGSDPIEVSPVFEMNGHCCVNVTWEDGCCGRPFLVEETARTARAVARADWSSSVAPVVAGLSADERAALAAGWAEDGLAEHASVAAFARFALQLLALGAPASLVAAAQQAMADEIAHARLCFGLSAAYGGAALGPSALPLAGALAGADDLTAVAVATLREGCIGETIAAMQAEAALDRARDPAVRAALARIAADELRHAELAWRFVAWALERGGREVHAACVAALAASEAAFARSACSDRHVLKDMSDGICARGRLGAAGRAAVARRAMTAVIVPAARALLTRHAPLAAA